MHHAADSCCVAAGARCEFIYTNVYPPLINDPAATHLAADVAAQLVGNERVERAMQPVLGSEDFAYMLEEKKGAYILLGNGKDSTGGCMLHDPYYDFNDEVLELGARYWVALTEHCLPM